jgi:hypothetical protein
MSWKNPGCAPGDAIVNVPDASGTRAPQKFNRIAPFTGLFEGLSKKNDAPTPFIVTDVGTKDVPVFMHSRNTHNIYRFFDPPVRENELVVDVLRLAVPI